MNNQIRKGITHSGIFVGLLFLLVGTILMMFNFGMLSAQFRPVFFSWQMLLIGIGILSMIVRRNIFSGLWFFVIGVFMLIPKIARYFPDVFPNIPPDFVYKYWPILLIATGVIIILYWFFPPKSMHNLHFFSNYRKKQFENYMNNDNNNATFQKSTICGESTFVIFEPEFAGGMVNAIFGSLTIDLRKTTPKHNPIYLEANVIFGEIKIFVPEDWKVDVSSNVILGSFTDKRILHHPVDDSKYLIIRGNCILGSGELRS